jgi:hypothetical protein
MIAAIINARAVGTVKTAKLLFELINRKSLLESDQALGINLNVKISAV